VLVAPGVTTGVKSRSWKSKLKSVSGETGAIFIWLIAPSGLSANVTKASASRLRSRQRALKVSYCQCSISATRLGVWSKCNTSASRSVAMVISPYQGSRYRPAYLATGSEGLESALRLALCLATFSAASARCLSSSF